MAETETFLPETGLPKASFKVTVIVDIVVLSAGKLAGAAEMVDTLADTAPAVKVTATVLDKATLSVVSVAEIVLVSALVDFMVPVATPLALVAAAG